MSNRPRRNIDRVDYTVPDEGDGFDVESLTGTEENDIEGFETASSGATDVSFEDTVVAEPVEQAAVEPILSESVVMADARVRELTAELETVFFQLDEIADDAEDDELVNMSLREATRLHEELKVLRVNMIKLHHEYKLISANDAYAVRVPAKSNETNDLRKKLKTRISALEGAQAKVEDDQAARLRDLEYQKEVARQRAFLRAAKEIENMFVKLNNAYTAPARDLNRDAMLKRRDEKPILAVEFDRFRERVDNLIQTDVLLQNREAKLDEIVRLSEQLEYSKELYEKKVYDDLVANDLTEEVGRADKD